MTKQDRGCDYFRVPGFLRSENVLQQRGLRFAQQLQLLQQSAAGGGVFHGFLSAAQKPQRLPEGDLDGVQVGVAEGGVEKKERSCQREKAWRVRRAASSQLPSPACSSA